MLRAVMEVVYGQRNILQIVGAASSARRLARRLHCRQQESHQDADNRNDYEELHERETM